MLQAKYTGRKSQGGFFSGYFYQIYILYMNGYYIVINANDPRMYIVYNNLESLYLEWKKIKVYQNSKSNIVKGAIKIGNTA